ncbi:PQQ-binding-like beta-propeller repeat protein [Streptomyces sp. NRRL S-448]|uniref:outer membrane protein assembly factor BamB family protein n=1 Tax=Streptomyces sp. NRRL S-448 TaxID=1463907 RepID=UPI003562AD9F
MATRTTRSNDDEPNGDSSARRERTPRFLIRGGAIVALICAGIVASVFIAGRFPGDSMDIAWEAPADGTVLDQVNGTQPYDSDGTLLYDGDGSWLAGDTLVRSRSYVATGHDAGTGKQVWEYWPPRNSKICATKADVDQSVMVVTRDDENRPASDEQQLCTTLAAVDMKNGREIWRTSIPALDRTRRFGNRERAQVTAGGGLTVLTHQGLRAVDVRTGTPRWTAAVPPNCVPAHALPAVRHVGALLACGGSKREPNGIAKDAELHAAAFDPATGALLWSTPMGDRQPVVWGQGGAHLVSAAPLVVDDNSAYRSFSRDGRPNPPISSRSLSIGTVAVDDTRLYSIGGRYVKGVGTRHHAMAFDLATGRQVWKNDLDTRIGVFHLQDGRLTVVGERRDLLMIPAVRLYLLDPATGEERDVRRFHYGEDPVAEAFEYKGLLIVGGTAYKRS